LSAPVEQRRVIDSRRAILHAAVGAAIAALAANTWLVGGVAVPLVVAGGSMAPVFQGAHVAWSCAACGQEFTCGVESLPPPWHAAVCPTCRAKNTMSSGTEQPGDRVVVDRAAFAWRSPKRFELVVCRSPDDPQSLCVKRVVGLPGERLRIAGGELWCDGKIVRKTVEQQREVAVSICSASDANGQEVANRWHDGSDGWKWDKGRFVHQAERHCGLLGRCILEESGESSLRCSSPLVGEDGEAHQRKALAAEPGEGADITDCDAPDIHWLTYRHPAWGHDPDSQGVIYDDSPYDQLEQRLLHAVGDVLLHGELRVEGQGDVFLKTSSPSDTFVVRLPIGGSSGTLEHNGRRVASTNTSPIVSSRATPFEWTLADQQVRLAINGQVVLEYPYEPTTAVRNANTSIAIGARGAKVILTRSKILRDVYYVSPHQNQAPTWQIGADEYFLLGDNSAHSRDSRAWSPSHTVSAMLIVGKAIRW
jgi:signal peptidase I